MWALPYLVKSQALHGSLRRAHGACANPLEQLKPEPSSHASLTLRRWIFGCHLLPASGCALVATFHRGFLMRALRNLSAGTSPKLLETLSRSYAPTRPSSTG